MTEADGVLLILECVLLIDSKTPQPTQPLVEKNGFDLLNRKELIIYEINFMQKRGGLFFALIFNKFDLLVNN